MDLPFFYLENLKEKKIVLDEGTSKHVISVLRMIKGQEVQLTNGKGKKAKATILDDNRKKCVVEIVSVEEKEEPAKKVTIAIALIKNASRIEWFLEKATEIGVTEIIPLLCERTEKEKFRYERMQHILISAMLQSQQAWLPVLHEPTDFETAITHSNHSQKFIAHCLPDAKQQLSTIIHQQSWAISKMRAIILIGPEGDFTSKEIKEAVANSFQPVALGNTRLRTETAGVVAATLLMQV